MTRRERDELRRLLGEATDGPWRAGRSALCKHKERGERQCWNVWRLHEEGPGTDITAPCSGLYEQDAVFIANARNYLEELLDECDRLEGAS